MDTIDLPTAPRAAVGGEPGRSHLRWVAIAVLALVIDLVDNFWITSLRGAVGAIEQIQEPFDAWVRTSTLMLPFYVLAVAGAALLARRLARRVSYNVVRSLIVGVLVVATTMLVGIGVLTVNAVRDYHTQSAQLAVMHANHQTTASSATDPVHAGHDATTSGCDALCHQRRSTLEIDERAVGYGTVVLLISNAVIVAFLVVLWGLRLWTRRTPTARRTRPSIWSLARARRGVAVRLGSRSGPA